MRLLDQIIDYLKNHKNATMIDMQFEIGFNYSQWRKLLPKTHGIIAIKRDGTVTVYNLEQPCGHPLSSVISNKCLQCL